MRLKMKKTPKYIHQDLLVSLILTAVGLFFFIGSFFIKRETNPTLNTHTFPLIISSILLIFCVFNLKASIKATKELNEKIARGENAKVLICWKELKYPTIGAGIILAYIIGVCLIGFFPASVVFMIAMPYWLGYRKFHVTIPVMVGVLAFVYVLFVMVLNTKLPAGILFK